MKRLKKLKLNNLEQGFLNDREMNILRGGGTPGNCNCGCGYANYGGSTTSANSSANNANGYTISYGCGDGGGGEANTNTWDGCNQGFWKTNDNWDCVGPVNCNNEPNKC